METFTLESGSCPRCQIDNSHHIDKCHACGAPLPWAGTEEKRLRELQAEKAAHRGESVAERIVWMVIGAVIFCFGAFLWIGNVSHLFITYPFAGYLTMLAGGAIFKKGNEA